MSPSEFPVTPDGPVDFDDSAAFESPDGFAVDSSDRLEGDIPVLRDPILVAAFEGWNDAGDAASGAVEHLELIWDAQPLAELDSEDYYDYQVNRPTVRQVDGVTREIVWPATRLSVCSPPGSESDIVLLRGIEPNMRWRSFCEDLLELIDQLNVKTVVILGALLADTPHTRPVPVTGTAYSSESAARFNLEQTRYEGPTGITGVLQDECVRAGVPAISFWAAVPHYVSQPPNPKATVALLQRVEDVLDIEVPSGTPGSIGRLGGSGQRNDRGRRGNRRVRAHSRGTGTPRPTSVKRSPRSTATPSPRNSSATSDGEAPAASDCEQEHPRRRRRSPQRPLRLRLQLIALYAGGFLGPFGGGVVASILPEIGDDLGVGPSAAASSLTAYLLPFAALMLVSGTLGTRWGKVRTVRIAYGSTFSRRWHASWPRLSKSFWPPGYCRAPRTHSPHRYCLPLWRPHTAGPTGSGPRRLRCLPPQGSRRLH
ncbi:hypothetical protein GCM10020255_082890 [Rhodococcus baikonurensis]